MAEADAVAAMAALVGDKSPPASAAEKLLPLQSLVHHGIACPGRGRLIVSIQGITWFASLEADGTITRANAVYANPRNLVLAMENTVRAKDLSPVTEPSSDCWRIIRYRLPGNRSVPLGKLRQVAIDMYLQLAH